MMMTTNAAIANDNKDDEYRSGGIGAVRGDAVYAAQVFFRSSATILPVAGGSTHTLAT
jgi:hypothetical protein